MHGLLLILILTIRQDALGHFLRSESPEERRAAAAEVLASRIDFDTVLSRLRQGRTYSGDVPGGRLLRTRTGVDSRPHPYIVLVPEEYDPARTWPVRLDLHGGMGASEWKKVDGSWSPNWLSVPDYFVIAPAGWWDSMWWEWSQVENFEAILAEVKRTYNIAENRVVMYGGSDGCIALFFQAFRQPDRWCGFAGHVGSPDRLVRQELRPDGQMHLSNLRGQRFHTGYGERDPKCPLVHLTRYMELFQQHGAHLDWYVNAGEDHNLAITQEQERALGRFLFTTLRDPLPDRLTWATERTDRYNRRSWLVIDELETAGATHEVDETNLLPRWGIRIQLRGPTVKRLAWGRVELERDGNTVRATTRRVKRFTLLISPDEFDLAAPVEVVVDGRTVFHGLVEPELETLLKWALVDDDRTLLFAAELALEL